MDIKKKQNGMDRKLNKILFILARRPTCVQTEGAMSSTTTAGENDSASDDPEVSRFMTVHVLVLIWHLLQITLYTFVCVG